MGTHVPGSVCKKIQNGLKKSLKMSIFMLSPWVRVNDVTGSERLRACVRCMGVSLSCLCSRAGEGVEDWMVYLKVGSHAVGS